MAHVSCAACYVGLIQNYDEVSVKTANLILGQVNLKPDAVLGLATGGSPVGAYKKIVEAYNNGEVDFSGVTTINLDEYRGIKRNHEQSYWSFMQENLFVCVPPEHELAHYESLTFEEINGFNFLLRSEPVRRFFNPGEYSTVG